MTHLETEIRELKVNIIEMWNIVISQISKSQLALKNFDKNIVYNIEVNEKLLNTLELKIDKECESILVQQNPIKVDLKFVLVVLKLNNNLEKIGDYAFSISKLIEDQELPFSEKLLKSCKIFDMFEICVNLLTDTLESFEKENNELLKTNFGKKETIKKLNKDSSEIVAEYINTNQSEVNMAVNTLSIIRKLDRTCDNIQNIVEEMVFYFHSKKVNKVVSH
jgi:phosphate transport system protein